MLDMSPKSKEIANYKENTSSWGQKSSRLKGGNRKQKERISKRLTLTLSKRRVEKQNLCPLSRGEEKPGELIFFNLFCLAH
jgi:hypothetical protein